MPYKTQSSDTTKDAEMQQIAVLRRLGMKKRVAAMRRLSRSQLQMAWAALKKANPQKSERELQVHAVKLWYGEEHALRLEEALKERGKWS